MKELSFADFQKIYKNYNFTKKLDELKIVDSKLGRVNPFFFNYPMEFVKYLFFTEFGLFYGITVYKNLKM